MEAIGIIGILQGLHRDSGKDNGSYRDYRDSMGLFWGYICRTDFEEHAFLSLASHGICIGASVVAAIAECDLRYSSFHFLFHYPSITPSIPIFRIVSIFLGGSEGVFVSCLLPQASSTLRILNYGPLR